MVWSRVTIALASSKALTPKREREPGNTGEVKPWTSKCYQALFPVRGWEPRNEANAIVTNRQWMKMKVTINISHDENFEHYISMLHNNAVRLAKISMENFPKVALISYHRTYYTTEAIRPQQAGGDVQLWHHSMMRGGATHWDDI